MIKKPFIFGVFVLYIAVATHSQQVVFQEEFENYTISEKTINDDFSNKEEAYGFIDLSNYSGEINAYATPLLDLYSGVSFLNFVYKQKITDTISGGLKVYYRNSIDENWKPIACFNQTIDEWTKATLFIPGESKICWLMFASSGLGTDYLFVDDIQIIKYKNASAFARDKVVYVDTEFNFSSSFLRVDVSKYQIAGLPIIKEENSQLLIPGTPVGCPSTATLFENEPICYDNYLDTINSGCTNAPNRFSELNTCNGVICGKSGNYFYNNLLNRDVDSYRLMINSGTNISFKVVADFKVKVVLNYLPYDCDLGYFPLGANNFIVNAGDTANLTFASTIAYNMVLYIAPAVGQTVPCGSNYVVIYKTDPNTPDKPVAAANPSFGPTQLNAMTSLAYTYYWQGTSCSNSMINPANVPYLITNSGNYYVKGKNNLLGCWSPCTSVNVSVDNSDKNLQVKLFLEGLSSGNGTLNETKLDAVTPKWGPGIADKVMVELHDPANYNNVIYSFNNVNLYTNGIANMTIPAIYNKSYYLSVKHRSSIETVSSSAVSFAGPGINYDFTTSASSVYGNNIKPVSGGYYDIYCGDINQDGTVDGTDMAAIDNASSIILTGYNTQDLNGDGIVDGSDMAIVDNNATLIISKKIP